MKKPTPRANKTRSLEPRLVSNQNLTKVQAGAQINPPSLQLDSVIPELAGVCVLC